MKAWDDEFGYELISDEKQLDFGAADPALSARLSKTVADARQRQAAIIAMMPRRYQGDEPLKSFAADPATMAPSQRSGGVGGLGSGTGSGNGVSSGSGNGTGLPGGSGPAGGGFAGGSRRAAVLVLDHRAEAARLDRGMPGGGPGGIGQTGFAGGPGGGGGAGNGASPWTGAGGGNSGGPFGSGGGAGNYGGMPGSGTVGGSGLANRRRGGRRAGGFPQSALNGGASGSTFGGGAGQGGSGQGGTGQGGGGQAGGGQAGGGQVAGGPSLGSAGSGLGGGGNASSAAAIRAAALLKAGWFGQWQCVIRFIRWRKRRVFEWLYGGRRWSGGRISHGRRLLVLDGPVRARYAQLQLWQQPEVAAVQFEQQLVGQERLALRLESWQELALPDAKPHQIGVTRPIRVSVLADRIILVPEVGDDHGPQIVKVAPELGPDDVNHFVTAVQNEVKGWGLAVSDGYWKPVLQADVAPEAERHFLNLQTALSGSGIDIVRR